MFIFYNDQVYNSDTYNDDVLTKQMELSYRTMNRNSRVMQTYSLQKETLESEETYLGIDLFPLEIEFFRLKEGLQFNDGRFEDSFGGFQIQMSLDIVNHNRSIYSFLDLLGDVGGLFSILLSLSQIIVSMAAFIFGISYENHLVKNIFKRDTFQLPFEAPDHSNNAIELNNLAKVEHGGRKSFLNYLCFRRKIERRKLLQTAATQIDKELEIGYFIRKQMTVNIVLKTLFTQTERFLIKN